MADKLPTHRALRPIKFHNTVYGPGLPAGSLLTLDDETAANLGVTAVEPYTLPVAAMTGDQLAQAAKDAKAREKAEADAAKAIADTAAKAAADAQKEAAK